MKNMKVPNVLGGAGISVLLKLGIVGGIGLYAAANSLYNVEGASAASFCSMETETQEEWFFHRLKAGRPIPIPSSGLQITQLGHVKDLAKAFIQVLGNEKASKEVFNISGEKYVTFDGLARACAKRPQQGFRVFSPVEA
ncbi:hypothetical protein JHK86_055595 [Glycine max]|nr:hypothetical protein JHK86_055595 [Glycine max]